MFFRALKPKTDVTLKVSLVHIHLPVRLGHRDATAAFAEPLSRQLMAAGLGTVIDCSERPAAKAEIAGVDLTLGMTQASIEDRKTVARMLEHLHAPYGSSIRLADGGQPLVFGAAEGMELSVESRLAPDADSRRDVAKSCAKALKGHGISRGWSRRDNRTVFYFYGESFDSMQKRLRDTLASHPLLATAATRRMA